MKLTTRIILLEGLALGYLAYRLYLARPGIEATANLLDAAGVAAGNDGGENLLKRADNILKKLEDQKSADRINTVAGYVRRARNLF